MIDKKIIFDKAGWTLCKTNNQLYFQSNLLLARKFQHAFFTKRVLENNPEQLNKIFSKANSIHYVNQSHSNIIVKASETNNIEPSKADGIISDSRLQGLWIYTADCMPIFIGDFKSGRTAAIHCGWKGLKSNIIEKAIDIMLSSGCNKEDIIIAIGPSISCNNFQVDITLANELLDTINQQKISTSKKNLKELFDLGYILNDRRPSKVRIDIKLLAVKQLMNKGININNISISKECTYTQKKLFNSWRREGSQSRQFSVILSR